MADDEPWWEYAWGSRAEREAFFAGARKKIWQSLTEGRPVTAREVLLAGKMRRWKARNADGMRFPPQTTAEHRVWNDFGLHERGRNSHMDIGDVVTALSAVNDEIDTATGEAQAVQEKYREEIAAVEALRQRVDQAVGSLKATAGASVPAGLTAAVEALEAIDETLVEDMQGLENAINEVDEQVTARLAVAKEAIETYINALLEG